MKKVNLFISMLLYVIVVLGQTNYYSTTKTFKENGYTYQCDVPASKMVSLYNKDNKWVHDKRVYKDTGKAFIMPESGIKLLQDDNWTYSKCHSIVNDALSMEERQRVKGLKLSMSMYINPMTGKIDDVRFRFLSIHSLATIPVSVYRKIETELKKEVWFTPTSEGKKLNYIFRWWMHDFK